jgi:hypothetical protein
MVKINSFHFGSLTINNKTYKNDMTIHWDGELNPRESSHTVSKEDMIDFLLKGPEVIVVGTGIAGNVKIDKDAENFLRLKNVELIIKKTPEAVEEFNKISKQKKVIALMHVTC